MEHARAERAAEEHDGFVRLVQPILDRHCVRCHDGSTGADKAPPVLTAEPAGRFSNWRSRSVSAVENPSA